MRQFLMASIATIVMFGTVLIGVSSTPQPTAGEGNWPFRIGKA
jgi:hypothetical protein